MHDVSTPDDKSQVISSLVGSLHDSYGPMMDMAAVCEVAHYTPGGLRDALWAKRSPAMCALAAAKVKIGRRVLWPTVVVARILAGGA